MDGMVRLVVDALGLQAPPAKGSDIVVGQECAATNNFLQLLALAAHSHHTQQQRHQTCGTGDHDDNLRNQVWATQTIAAQKRGVAVATSEDGVTWEETEFFRQRGGSGDETADENNKSKISGGDGGGAGTLALTAATPAAARYLRLTSTAEGCCVKQAGKGNTATPSSTALATTVAGTPAAPAFGPGYSTSGHGNEARNTNTALRAFRVRIVGVGPGGEAHTSKGRMRGVAGEADRGNGEGESVQASRK